MMTLNIVSPEKELFKGDIKEVTVPGELGSFMILRNHAPIVSSLVHGTIKYVTTDGSEHTQEVSEGFIEASDNIVTICIS